MKRNRSALLGGLGALLLQVGACSGAPNASVAAPPNPIDTPLIGSAITASAEPSDASDISAGPADASPTSPAGASPTIASTVASTAPSLLPPGPLTIAALGDSLTEGQGDDSGRGGYPGRLETLIDPLRPGTRIVNLGHSGWSSGDIINGTNGEPAELARAIAARPTVALVWVGSNDLWYLYEFGPEPMTDDAERRDLQTYEANLDRILGELTGHGIRVFIALLDDQSKRPVVVAPNPTEPAFPATTRADLARMAVHVKAYNEIIGRKAAQCGAVTVDFFGTAIFTDAATLYGDGNHPNSDGYDLVAQVWFKAIGPLLK